MPWSTNPKLAAARALHSFCRGCLYLSCLLPTVPAIAEQIPPQQQSIEHTTASFTSEASRGNAWWGVQAVDLESGTEVYALNAKRSFMPASAVKLYTTAAAISQLGPDYRFETLLLQDGAVAGGVLHGNLVVRGAGDPSVGSPELSMVPNQTFLDWADSLRAAGILRITGDIIGDDDIFDEVPLGHGWAWDDEVYGYSAEISGLAFHDNVVRVAIRPRAPGETGMVSWEPRTSYVTVLNSTQTTARGSRLEEGYHRARGTNQVVLRSKVPQGRTDYESIAVHNPTRFFVHVLRETLVQAGISVGGKGVDIDALSIKPRYETMRRVATHRSPPLSEIIAVINKNSQNLWAESLLRTIAARQPVEYSDLNPGSAEMGIAAAMETFLAAGLDTSRLQLVDGSGLSRKNIVTPAMTVKLLQYMASHPDQRVQETYMQSLAVGGRDGTLAYRFRSRSGPTVEVQAKTGSLGNVSTLSGYISTQRKRKLVFSIMCNHYTVPTKEIQRTQERLIALLARNL